jgi:hypothetical protein
MARRLRPRSTPAESVRRIIYRIPWKLLLLLPVLLGLAIPTYLFGVRLSRTMLSSLTNVIYASTSPPPSPTPTPLPPVPSVLPQVGTLHYTVQNGDSCDSILTFQMRMADAGTIFSDVKPNTVKALENVVGQNCHALQPGMVLSLAPQYPLVALGGVVLKISATTPQQVVPTPLINVPNQPLAPDCSGGCLLTVRITPQVQVHLLVQTTLAINIGSWIWAQATLARKTIPNFDTYPYADLSASLNDMSLRACDLQVDNTHDDNSLACDQLVPNTIDDDGGSWLFGVTGPSGLDHWHYPLNVPTNTRVLLWLSAQQGSLVFKKGNPLYRYDDATHVYVKV